MARRAERQGRDPRGKLKAVAREWATDRGGGEKPDQPDALTAKAAEALARIAERRGRALADTVIEIAEEDEDVVRLFRALTTQWRVHPFTGHRIGIDFAAVPAVAAMLEIAVTPAVFTGLRIMEGAALLALARK
ncbi:DUF1799 domain-containing protein [Sphingomonas cannabina]|uniref:DUF1799 domain-containing protein n=1 Tax=Sphingomonas cannabina TaxID=2899123 RepID=UPI001F47FFA3|nr:DUF1799 domain-containing protein [Sphingomonas cannabina]UIJ46898.1 DUF1799 domain-containing protein [Sphingomonas cannabina]